MIVECRFVTMSEIKLSPQHNHRGLKIYPCKSWLKLYNFLSLHVIPGPCRDEI